MTDDIFNDPYVTNAWNGNAEQWAHDVRAGYDKYRDAYTFPAFLNS